MASAQEKYDEVVAEMTSTSPAQGSKMFGMPCLKVNGKAFAGLYKESMTFKLGEPARSEALALPGAKLFDPMGGRPMREWVEIPANQASQWSRFARAAIQYVGR